MKFKFIATEKIAKKHDVLLLPADAFNTAITGQHIDPRDDKTSGNLTLKQMKGEIPLTAEQRKKFPYVLHPDKHISIKAGRVFDTDSYEDVAIMNLATLQDKIAESKSKLSRQKHYGYFENKEAEAKMMIDKADIEFEAMEKVRKCNEEEMLKVAMLLDYLIPEFIIDVKQQGLTLIKKEVYQLVKDHPEKVLECFTEDAKEDMHILNLVNRGILTRKESGFYDGSRYLGSNIQAVRDFMGKKESDMAVSRWATQLAQNTGRIANTKTEEEEVSELVSAAKSDIIEENFGDALDKLNKAYRKLPSEEILNLKQKAQESLTELEASKFDLNNLTEDQQKLHDEIKDLEVADLLNYATVKKVGKKADLAKLDPQDLLIEILKKCN